MKLAPRHEYTEEQERWLARAVTLEWLTLAYSVSVAVLMYLVLGSSQAMKTAWIEDLLSLLPPVMFLLATRFRNRQATQHFPYGFHRVASVGFLVAALALLVVGGYLIVDAGLKLVHREHPTIGMQSFFGIDLWLGWWMIPVLLWGTFPPVILGHLKKGIAENLYDKILYTDAHMNKADWMTAVAAIAGVLGVGFGFWWADAVAALFISIDIVRDGYRQTLDAVTGLLNRAPKRLDGSYDDIPNRIVETLKDYDWIQDAEVRMHEEGHVFFGGGYFISRDGKPISPQQVRDAMEHIKSLDWRVLDFALTVADKDKE